MIRVGTFIVALLLIAGSASTARGDLYAARGVLQPAGVQRSTLGQGVGAGAVAHVEIPPPSSALLDGWSGRSLSPTLPSTVPDARTEVRELPGLAGSASLFLSAMLSVGTWQVVRSAKRLHLLGTFPEWYHTGGPFQIGHAVAFDFDFHTPPLCLFEVPDQGGGYGPPLERLGWDDRPSRQTRRVVALLAPRAPPFSC